MIDTAALAALLARALLHSLWGGVVLLGVTALLLHRVRRRGGVELECRIAGAGAVLAALLPWLTVGVIWLTGRLASEAPPVLASAGGPVVRPAAVLRLMHAQLSADVARWVLLLWAAGALVLLLRLGLGAAWLRRRLAREGRRVTGQALAELARRAGLPRSPEVREWPAARGPFVTGWRRPVLVLPPGLDRLLGPAEWSSLLLHEFAHLQRRDLGLNLLLRFLGALAWYQAPFWYLLRELDGARERACDDRAVAAMGAALPLARALVLLEERRGQGLRLALAGTGGDFAARVRRILAGRAGNPAFRPGGVAPLLALLLTTGATLLFAGGAEGALQRWIRGVHAVIQAHDPAGPFTVELLGERLIAATIDGRALPASRIVQRGSEVALLDDAGRPELTLRVAAPGGIHWKPRPPRRP